MIPAPPSTARENLDNEAAVDFRDPRYAKIFQRLQGNIVKGHGRDHAVNIFVTFITRGDALRQLLRWLTRKYVTTAYQQLAEAEHYDRFKVPGSLFGNLFLTAGAYEKLGFGCELPEWFHDPDRGGASGINANFVDGMFATRDQFDDIIPPSEQRTPLEAAYADKTIDALVLLADDSKEFLLRKARRLMTRLERDGAARIVAVETGTALRNDAGEGIEHFGYVDGRSQPLFLTSDFKGAEGKTDVWDPFAALSLALRNDPGASHDPDAFGSYFVFRKLEQDVLRFSIAEQQLADALGLTGTDRKRAGAMIIGRFRDGTPLVLSQTDGFLPVQANNFRYDGLDAAFEPNESAPADPYGGKCPFQAHIRKVNPRQNVDTEDPGGRTVREMADNDRAHRIVRRGITYGERKRPPNTFQALEDLPSHGVGLLFACFQSSIRNQFAFMQVRWANNFLFRVGTGTDNQTGIDCVIGQEADEPIQHHRWRHEYGGDIDPGVQFISNMPLAESHTTVFPVHSVVTFRGGEFFFAPSLTFLLGT